MRRRAFIKSACGICMLGAAGMLGGTLAGCGTTNAVFKTEAAGGKVSVPLSLFDHTPVQIVRPKGAEADIAVQKGPDGAYTALLLLCTHQSASLTATGDGYLCPLHGSEFDKRGAVRRGPAERALKRYETSISGNDLIIHI